MPASTIVTRGLGFSSSGSTILVTNGLGFTAPADIVGGIVEIINISLQLCQTAPFAMNVKSQESITLER